ncbi:MAG: glycogen debranching enzyme family protein [Planctomycetes bacterium]|nr:glycogen debranching enzyme family protein [Planctomycetota bacterium]
MREELPYNMSAMAIDREWLEPDGLGGFASGTQALVRTRRYHALLCVAAKPPAERMVLVNGLEAWVTTPAGRFALSSQRYAPDVTYPDGHRRIESFRHEPWPQWRFVLHDGIAIDFEIVALHGSPATALRWRLLEERAGVSLEVRPLLSGRGFHSLHRENSHFRFAAESSPGRVRWSPYDGVPAVVALHNGSYVHSPDWYRRFQYDLERERGLDFEEDLASPGAITFSLDTKDATLVLAADLPVDGRWTTAPALSALESAISKEERRRVRLGGPLERAADAYVVRRGAGFTMIAGYPWFGDWGRDTFIALRGLCLATGRFSDAEQILWEWAKTASHGMLPNRFPDQGDEPEYNSVDAALWFVLVARELRDAAAAAGRPLSKSTQRALDAAVEQILDGHLSGSRHGIRVDSDGLLACGEAGVQLTWMDAKVEGRVVTPRVGKPVEVQALWIHALELGGTKPAHGEVLARARRSFPARFWSEERRMLADVVDVWHQPGTADFTLRPNSLFAVGGLPLVLLDERRARAVVDAAEQQLWTPMGLRSLGPRERGYAGRYEGGVAERDGAYHQGTVWPWLLGPFVEAWVRARGATPEVCREAHARFVRPLLLHLGEAGLGHVSEIADGDAPHEPRGCPFQAWSLGELLRLERVVLARR